MTEYEEIKEVITGKELYIILEERDMRVKEVELKAKVSHGTIARHKKKGICSTELNKIISAINAITKERNMCEHPEEHQVHSNHRIDCTAC